MARPSTPLPDESQSTPKDEDLFPLMSLDEETRAALLNPPVPEPPDMQLPELLTKRLAVPRHRR